MKTVVMSVRKSIFRSILRAVSEFEKEGFPCLGINPSDVSTSRVYKYSENLDIRVEIRSAFRSTHEVGDEDRALLVLRSLKAQLAVLRGAEQETRNAIHEWKSLLLQTSASWRHPDSVNLVHPMLKFSSAAEDAALLLARIHAASSDSEVSFLEIEDEEEGQSSSETLDSLAQRLQESYPAAFPLTARSTNEATSSPLAESYDEQLELISYALLRGPQRIKHEAVEWVYDGLAPLILPTAIKEKKGIPLTLALAFCSVARRLGVPAVPFCIDHDEGFSDGTHMETLAKHAGRAVVAAPPLGHWLVACPAPQAHLPDQWNIALHGNARFVDVTQKGKLLNLEQLEKYRPGAALEAKSLHTVPFIIHLASLCTTLAKTAMVAHQRRGESDLVAHYMYQVMALDPTAPEWGRALQPAELTGNRR